MAKSFPNKQQAANSNSCGPVCVQNIYEHFGMIKTLQQINADLNITPETVTFMSQLARTLHFHGLQTRIHTCNPHYLTYEWKNLNEGQLIEKIKKWITHVRGHNWMTDCIQFLFYLQEGGKVTIENVSATLIDSILEKGNVVLCCVEDSWLWEKRKIVGSQDFDDIKGQGTGHFITVYGSEGNEYLLSDPYPTNLKGKNGLYKTSKEHLLTCILMFNPQVLEIGKK